MSTYLFARKLDLELPFAAPVNYGVGAVDPDDIYEVSKGKLALGAVMAATGGALVGLSIGLQSGFLPLLTTGAMKAILISPIVGLLPGVLLVGGGYYLVSKSYAKPELGA